MESKRARGTLIIMYGRGDRELHWGVDDEAEVVAARTTFADLRRRGYLGYRMAAGRPPEALVDFDPKAEQIVMAPPMGGG
jgi:hypothetical protein